MKYYLPFFFLCYLIITMILPYWRVMKRTGKKAFVVPRDDSAQGFIGKIFRLLFLLALITILVNALKPEWNRFLLPARFLENELLQWTGLFLLHGSLLLIVIAQYQMNESWRVGFENDQKTDLVTHGLFSYSRNPVFLGMLLTMVGLFLVLPNALTFSAGLLTYVVLQIQARLEEAYLLSVQGDAYRKYMKEVRRWL